MKKTILIFLAGVFFWFNFLRHDQIVLGPGVFAPDQPFQEIINSPEVFELNGFTITPLADFAIKAKVLSKKNYYTDQESELSPMDLALGWGRMSDESVLQSIDISQSGRWYYWRGQLPLPIPENEISSYSANMHLIPENKAIKAKLKSVKKGDVLALQGKLVRADAKNDWHWVSSLSRTDSGANACELVLVEAVEIYDLD